MQFLSRMFNWLYPTTSQATVIIPEPIEEAKIEVIAEEEKVVLETTEVEVVVKKKPRKKKEASAEKPIPGVRRKPNLKVEK